MDHLLAIENERKTQNRHTCHETFMANHIRSFAANQNCFRLTYSEHSSRCILNKSKP